MSVPNQKRVIIGERVKRNKDNLYAMMNISALREAMQNLKGSSLKLWLYFNKNQDKYNFELSRSDCLSWGIKKDSYYSAVGDLIDKGYLVPIRKGGNTFVFFEIAGSEKQISNYSKYDIQDWENQTSKSEIQIMQSEKPERNNTDNTKIVQNNKKAASEEILMYTVLDKFFSCGVNVYKGDDGEKIGELLQNDYYWDIPEERIEQMTPEEKKELEKYYWKYNDYMWFL